MADFTYKKISQLPQVTTLASTDVFIVNASGHTSKISLSDLIKIVTSNISLTALEDRVDALETTTTNLGTTVTAQGTTINNIITAGFNLIGVE